MIKTTTLFFCLLFVISCNEKKQEEQVPVDLLNKSEMAAVLTDISLMEAAATIQTQQQPSIQIDSLLKFNVYKQHAITRTQYKTSLNYYSAHASEFKEVYAIVLENLNKQKGN